ncbi:hypothetical protein B0H14DRAFT_2581146 [Mycena olivaceomarginata]|nr:hypothetical protein B0H14DRAFT_2581146 [Mycena olivaceomarginata]
MSRELEHERSTKPQSCTRDESKSHEVADYQSRGEVLKDVCVWDFVAQIEKVSKASAKRKHRDESEENDEMVDVEYLDDLKDIGDILDYSGRLRPKVPLNSDHIQEMSNFFACEIARMAAAGEDMFDEENEGRDVGPP